ncbi:hypothetical protein ABH892_000454 [Paenibacillus sp. RC254]|uniref:hypothetical protein n=1 Tax=unclassified Paenibacillus TaxID=185978 RepID=UPI0024BB0841|nr:MULTISPECIES: hypothetical protein [unclassified Paenibacillus]
MASEKTPNLGLNQIDRTSPKTTYFDLEKYLDQNWRAVDNFAGDVNDGVDAIKKRLDTTERKAVTLEPGVQIVHAEKASPFSLTGLSGRTLVNLLGRWGNLSSLTGIMPYQTDLALDTTNKETMPNSLKVTIKSGYTVGVGFYSDFKFLAGKYYVAIAKVKVGNSTNAGISAPNVQEGTTVTDKTKFTTSWFRAAPTSNVTSNIDLRIQGTQGQYSYFEAVRIYEISATDYSALAAMTTDQIDAKYPYVDSVMPVRNPYAIRYGENLLPSLFEWSAKQGTPTIADVKSVSVTVDNKIVHTVSPLVPGQKYTVSVQSGGATGRITVTDEPETSVIAEAAGSGLLSVTFTAGRAVNVRLLGTSTTAVTISNPMLNIGSTAKPFKPREDSMLALQTDLYADPVTGANADMVFERDGQYFKVKRFESILLDGGRITKVNNVVSGTGFKVLYPVVPDVNYAFVGNGTAVKFDGKILLWGGQDTSTDRWAIDATASNFAVSVSVADSGWADSYAPTLDDIKAYFYGYKAYDANTITPAQAQAATTATWTGTGTKYWVQRVGAANFTQTVPQTSYAGYTPYQLVYQLATPTVEPIVSEGQLSFVEGDNQVEVGTGIVLRERAKPAKYDNYDINTGKSQGNALAQRVASYIGLYENGNRKLRGWGVFNGIDNGQAIAIYPDSYVSDASYSVTYLMLDKSPLASFVGSYAANEKTLLLDLVDSVQQNTARVSVLENKKVDKDNTTWIKPTLLNGWSSGQVGYLKMSDGLVLFRDSITGGAVAPGTLLFTLPKGYRPGKLTEIRVRSSNGGGVESNNSTIMVDALGQVKTQNTTYMTIWLDGVSFLAEQ